MPTFAHPPSKIFQQLLVDLSLGTLPSSNGAWPVHPEDEPDTPDNCITVETTVGVGSGSLMVNGEIQGTVGIQVRVRSNDRSAGWVKADAISTDLAESVALRSVSIGGRAYRIWQVTPGDVLPIGRDSPQGRRHLFTINCTATIVMTV